VLLGVIGAIGLVVLSVVGYVFVQFNGPVDDPWRAQVLSIDGATVCTKPDKGEKDPGWAVPFCMDDGLVTEHGTILTPPIDRSYRSPSSWATCSWTAAGPGSIRSRTSMRWSWPTMNPVALTQTSQR
jgi:hypothetical protein